MTIQDRQSSPPAYRRTGVTTSVIVPTFNESPNVAEVVRRVISAVGYREIEIVFVDDSTDDTPVAVLKAAEGARIPVRLIHRDHPVGGLSGAVLEGIAASDSDWCVVMDGDLQHPPEMIPVLLDSALDSRADIVIASRYIGGGTNEGLNGRTRKAVSRGSVLLAKTLFPVRLWDCSDPMTGFFAVRRRALDLTRLQPGGSRSCWRSSPVTGSASSRRASRSASAVRANPRPTCPRARNSFASSPPFGWASLRGAPSPRRGGTSPPPTPPPRSTE